MSNIISPKPWNIAEGESTPESIYMNRRDFIKGTTLATLAATASFYGCGIGPTPNHTFSTPIRVVVEHPQTQRQIAFWDCLACFCLAWL